jgi:N-acetylglucosamine-6-phosphate deacetylase
VPEVVARRVLTPGGRLVPASVVVDDGRIVAVDPAFADAPDRIVAPGFVDLQVNGHDDVDVAAADGADWDRLDELLLAQGVTTWCPTLVTAPWDRTGAALDRIAEAARRGGTRPTIAGAHLEGPFLGARPGAHRTEWIVDPTPERVAALPDHVRILTLGPERPGALEAVAALAGRGVVVALGHSAADHELALAAADAGARLVTHGFNAMEPLHHRAPGLVGTALTDPRLTVSLIADGVHVHPAVLRLALAAAPGRVALITDAVAWRTERLAGRGVRVVDGAPRLADGTLAGSALTMDGALRTVVEAGVDLAVALAAASATPARVLGMADRGRIEPGARADLVVLTPDLRPEQVWVGGVPLDLPG